MSARVWRWLYGLAALAIAWHGLSAWLFGVNDDIWQTTALCVLAISWNLDRLVSR